MHFICRSLFLSAESVCWPKKTVFQKNNAFFEGKNRYPSFRPNQMKQQMNVRTVFLGMACLLLNAPWAFAQIEISYPPYRWQLHTDAVSHQTTVAFYDDQNRVIYRETLPGRHIRLTARNVRRLDQMCVRLASHQLVASVVQSDQIAARTPPHPQSPGALPLLGVPLADSVVADFRVTVVPMAHHKIAVNYRNAGTPPVSIQLIDPAGCSVYQEISHYAAYKRYLDLDRLAAGIYQLTLSDLEYRYSYRFRVSDQNREARPVLVSAYYERIAKKPVLRDLNVLLHQQKPDRNQGRKRLGEENLFVSRYGAINSGHGHTTQKE